MTEQRFDELINLYLDNEIGRSDVGELKHAIKDNLVRRRKFERACELHQAARKALTSPGGEGGAENSVKNRPSSARPAASSGSRSSFTRRGNPSGPPRESVKSKQSQAHRNASVSVLAERQVRSGAASSVDLTGISLESRSSKPGSGLGGPRNYSFFDSPLGILAGIVLTLFGAAGMYFVIRSVSPDNQEDPGKFSALSPITQLDGGYDPKAAEDLAAEIKKKNAKASANDVMRARLYQSALTGQAADNTTTVDYFSAHSQTSQMGTLSGNAIADLQPLQDGTTGVVPAKPDSSSGTPTAQP